MMKPRMEEQFAHYESPPIRLANDTKIPQTPLHRRKLSPVATKSLSSFRKSSNEREKQCQILAKGHHETYEIVNPMEYARFLTVSVGEHVSENGDTCS
jgi:hypothetical protein